MSEVYRVILEMDIESDSEDEAKSSACEELLDMLMKREDWADILAMMMPINVDENTCECGRFWGQIDIDGGRCLGCGTMICAITKESDDE